MKTPDRIDGDLKEGLREGGDEGVHQCKPPKRIGDLQFDYNLIRKPDNLFIFKRRS
jgi:hypothetical protein